MALQWSLVEFAYPQGSPVLPGWSWQAQPGLVQLVDGYSVGKTTALQLLAGRLQATGGTLQVDGATPQQLQAAYQLFWHEPRKADSMPPETTTLEQWAAHLQQHFAQWDAALLAQLQAGFDLLPHWHKPLLALSTGSLRKAVMALGLASGAKLVLLDEPLSGLDKPAMAFAQQALQAAAQRFADTGRYLVLAHYEELVQEGGVVQTVELPV